MKRKSKKGKITATFNKLAFEKINGVTFELGAINPQVVHNPPTIMCKLLGNHRNKEYNAMPTLITDSTGKTLMAMSFPSGITITSNLTLSLETCSYCGEYIALLDKV